VEKWHDASQLADSRLFCRLLPLHSPLRRRLCILTPSHLSFLDAGRQRMRSIGRRRKRSMSNGGAARGVVEEQEHNAVAEEEDEKRRGGARAATVVRVGK
jgi:hypothetical protein